jgi:hypothetical protein
VFWLKQRKKIISKEKPSLFFVHCMGLFFFMCVLLGNHKHKRNCAPCTQNDFRSLSSPPNQKEKILPLGWEQVFGFKTKKQAKPYKSSFQEEEEEEKHCKNETNGKQQTKSKNKMPNKKKFDSASSVPNSMLKCGHTGGSSISNCSTPYTGNHQKKKKSFFLMTVFEQTFFCCCCFFFFCHSPLSTSTVSF